MGNPGSPQATGRNVKREEGGLEYYGFKNEFVTFWNNLRFFKGGGWDAGRAKEGRKEDPYKREPGLDWEFLNGVDFGSAI